MAFTLARHTIEEILNYPVLVSTFEDQTEQRRLKTGKKLMGFRIQSPALTKTQMQSYRTELINSTGALTAFEFTSPFDDVTYDVRFSENGIRTEYRDGVFLCSFEFIVIGEA